MIFKCQFYALNQVANSKIIRVIACRAYGPKSKFKIKFKTWFTWRKAHVHTFIQTNERKLYVSFRLIIIITLALRQKQSAHVSKISSINLNAWLFVECNILNCMDLSLRHRTNEKKIKKNTFYCCLRFDHFDRSYYSYEMGNIYSKRFNVKKFFFSKEITVIRTNTCWTHPDCNQSYPYY